MFLQVLLRFREQLASHVIGTEFALHYDIPTLPPVVQHHLRTAPDGCPSADEDGRLPPE